MNKNKIFNYKNIFSLVLVILILSSSFPLKGTSATNPNSKCKGAQGVCQKCYYRPTDIVGYFYNYKLKEALYITYDWCVVKPLLWYGTIFGNYNVTADEVQKNIDYLFPERQVYFGLVPGYFFKDGGNYLQRGKFTTEQHLKEGTGYFLNDNPFKNIFSGNFPKPPRFVDDPTIFSTYGVATPKGSIAPLIMDRMAKLHIFFSNFVVKGSCNNISFAQKYSYYCDYFATRTKTFVPSQYFGFDKLPEYNP